MWNLFDNISLETSFIKEEEVVSKQFVVTGAAVRPGLHLADGTVKEESQDPELLQPRNHSDPHLCPYMEVSVKIEEHTKNSSNEVQLQGYSETTSTKLFEDCNTAGVGSNDQTNMSFGFSPKEINVFVNCYVRLEHMCPMKNQRTFSTFEKIRSKQSNTHEKSQLQLITTDKMAEHGVAESTTHLCEICHGHSYVRKSCTCRKNMNAKYSSKSHTTTNKRQKNKAMKCFECKDCSKRFTTKYSLVNHAQIHTGDKPHSCSFCNKAFSKSVNLTRHERIHTGEKPYCCNVCKKRFSVKINLVIHIRIHTQEKPFSCDFCSKLFAHASDLKKHERVHTGEKPFTCDNCMKHFARKYSLVKHLRTHTKKIGKWKKIREMKD